MASCALCKKQVLRCDGIVPKPNLFWLLGLAFERKADAPSCWKQIKVKRNDRRFGVISAACKAGALPAELHVPRFFHPTDQYTSCKNSATNDEQPISWNTWNTFLGKDKTVAHTLGFGEPSWEVFFKCRVQFPHLLRLVGEPELPQVFLALLGASLDCLARGKQPIPSSASHVHALKHTRCSLLIDAGLDFFKVGLIAGRAALSSTLRYVHGSQTLASRAAQARD